MRRLKGTSNTPDKTSFEIFPDELLQTSIVKPLVYLSSRGKSLSSTVDLHSFFLALASVCFLPIPRMTRVAYRTSQTDGSRTERNSPLKLGPYYPVIQRKWFI